MPLMEIRLAIVLPHRPAADIPRQQRRRRSRDIQRIEGRGRVDRARARIQRAVRPGIGAGNVAVSRNADIARRMQPRAVEGHVPCPARQGEGGGVEGVGGEMARVHQHVADSRTRPHRRGEG